MVHTLKVLFKNLFSLSEANSPGHNQGGVDYAAVHIIPHNSSLFCFWPKIVHKGLFFAISCPTKLSAKKKQKKTSKSGFENGKKKINEKI